MIVIITTFRRYDLLKRTLNSLSNAIIPNNLKRIYIVENGIRCGIDDLINYYSSYLPIKYLFSEKPNKSSALNMVLDTIDNQFIIFFDDDVRVSKNTLVHYSNAMKNFEKGYFFCGRCLIDYETEPSSWLKHYLPPSVVGWDLGNNIIQLVTPDALGANWGAFSEDIRDCGRFDELRGPGSLSRGQETEMQRKLLANGIKAFYLPDAIVWHYVPETRCTEQWALNRIYQKCVDLGMELYKEKPLIFFKTTLSFVLKIPIFLLIIIFFGPKISYEKKFKYKYELSKYYGFLKGIITGLSKSLNTK